MSLAIAHPVRGLSTPMAHDFRSLFESQCAYVWTTLRRLGVARADLEDVCHEVFVTIHRHLDEYDPSRPLRPWLFLFAYRQASDYRRRSHRRHERLGDGLEPADDSPLPDELAEQREDRSLVLHALDALDLEKRAVLVMHEIDGYPMPQVAAALAIPLNTGYSRLRLARQEFARAVRQLSGPRERER
ncbi:MAG TPA: sigma-70 family RNA polymerase sigma factor [Polyangiaceae bacterium]